MVVRFYIMVVGFLVAIQVVSAQEKRDVMAPDMPLMSDSNVVDITIKPVEIKDSERTERFYDSIHSKKEKGGVRGLLFEAVFRRPKKDTSEVARVLDETKQFALHEGKIIGQIIINRHIIYDKDSRGLKKWANKTHHLTRDATIRRDLLFKSGDKVSPNLMVRNKQLLRSRKYIADVEIGIVPREHDTTMVDVLVWTRDSWSVGVDGKYRNKGRTMVELYDANFLGTGTSIAIETNFDRRNFNYRGNVVKYDMPNILGTLIKGSVTAGRSFEEEVYKLHLQKDFMKPTDYNAGFKISDERREYYQIYLDTTTVVRFRGIDIWGGKSFYVRSLKSSIYLTARYDYKDFLSRPASTNHRFNPAYHSYDNALMALGIYREKFYSANMIYGFGNKEYLAAGYKAEVVFGYSWGEFDDDLYAGVNLSKGGFTSVGYFSGKGSLGSFIDPQTGTWWRSSVDIELDWFSNLYRYRRSSLRQFVSLNYTRGWNRAGGSNELLEYTKESGPRTISEYMTGINRIALNTETVVFTPYKPIGFRLAIFGFADFGLLGNHGNMFKNPFATTLGLGIRLKNERLVFNTIQIKVGIALGKGGLLDNRYMRLSSEQRTDTHRFIPMQPEAIEFR